MPLYLSRLLKMVSRTVIAIIICGLLTLYVMLTQPLVDPIISVSPKVDAMRLETHVRFLTETVYPRNYQHPHNLNAAADYIAKTFKDSGARVTEQVFKVNNRSYRNIIAHFGQSDQAGLIIGAHYDSHAKTPGADDNASGVAGLLALAFLLKDHPPSQPVELVAYTLEEPPFFDTKDMGSAIHAKSMKASGRDIKLMIALEMIGYFKDDPHSQTYPFDLLKWLYPTEGNFIGIIGRLSEQREVRRLKALMSGATDLPVYSINAPTFVRGLDFSDHRNYWDENIPALMITNTAFFRNFNYHQLTDTAETLDYVRMAKVVEGVYAIVQRYAR